MEKRHQVFINFRGKDERLKLVPHLIHHLEASNVNVVMDDDATGKRVEKLFKYIRNSRIVIVIFSISYLESRCCLDELVEIMKCLETKKLEFAIPIFYKVEPSHVKYQTGNFGERFVALQNKHPDSIKTWKEALKFVAGSIGLTYQKKRCVCVSVCDWFFFFFFGFTCVVDLGNCQKSWIKIEKGLSLNTFCFAVHFQR